MINEHEQIGLRDLIEQIKEELDQSHSEEAPFFVVGNVELEVSITASRKLDGGVNLTVVTGSGERGTEHVHRVKVVLEPVIQADALGTSLSPKQIKRASRALLRGDDEEL